MDFDSGVSLSRFFDPHSIQVFASNDSLRSNFYKNLMDHTQSNAKAFDSALPDYYQMLLTSAKLEVGEMKEALSEEQWLAAFDADGRITNSEAIKKIVLTGVRRC